MNMTKDIKPSSYGITFKLPDGFFNERRLEREAKLRIAQALGYEIVSLSNYAEQELLDIELGVCWYDEIGCFDDMNFFTAPYPHYAFPRALPTELKGISV
jgi:hypothetical protein